MFNSEAKEVKNYTAGKTRKKPIRSETIARRSLGVRNKQKKKNIKSSEIELKSSYLVEDERQVQRPESYGDVKWQREGFRERI